jgi:hypothetical protein
MPPNNAFEPTPLRVEQDRTDFESRIRLERFPDLAVRRGSMLTVGRRSISSFSHCILSRTMLYS